MSVSETARVDGRAADELRPVSFERDFTTFAAGSVLVAFGRTRVLCTASIDEDVPRWLRGSGRGWVTAEYSMLPGSSAERVNREAAREAGARRVVLTHFQPGVDREQAQALGSEAFGAPVEVASEGASFEVGS